jgi:hypothetical protein
MMILDPSMQANPWLTGAFGQQTGLGWPQFAPIQGFGVSQYPGFGQQPGLIPQQLGPQTWYGNPLVSSTNPHGNALSQLAFQQIPQLVYHAQQIAQQVPQLIPQIPQLIQQNPQLLQQAPQLQQIPQVLQQAAVLAQQVPQVLQALCSSPQTQVGAYGSTPGLSPVGGYRPFGYGQTAFA